MVLHPWSKDLKVNYHRPVLVTEGGLDETDSWQEQSYISYTESGKIWQAAVLSQSPAVVEQKDQPGELPDPLFRRYIAKDGLSKHSML